MKTQRTFKQSVAILEAKGMIVESEFANYVVEPYEVTPVVVDPEEAAIDAAVAAFIAEWRERDQRAYDANEAAIAAFRSGKINTTEYCAARAAYDAYLAEYEIAREAVIRNAVAA